MCLVGLVQVFHVLHNCCFASLVQVLFSSCVNFAFIMESLFSHPRAAAMFKAYVLIAFSGVVAASYNTSNATGFANSQILQNPFPHYFPQESASPAQLFALPTCNGVKIEEATIDDLQTFMANGSLTSVQLVTCYMQRSYQTAEYIK